MIYKVTVRVTVTDEDGNKIDEYKLDRYFDEDVLEALKLEDK